MSPQAVKIDVFTVKSRGDFYEMLREQRPHGSTHSFLLFHCDKGRSDLSKKENMKLLVSLACVAVVLSGCAVSKQWEATGGSKADGVVRLSYEVGSMQTAKLNEQQGIDLATRRCKTWGYTGAEAFGGATRRCNAGSGFGCDQWVITKEYQCTGEAPAKK